MRNFILKTPLSLIVFLFFARILGSDLFLGTYFPAIFSDFGISVLNIIKDLVTILWLFALVDFFSFETKSYDNTTALYLLIVLLSILDAISYMESIQQITRMIMGMTYLTIVVFLFKKIKQLFNARSSWFIVIELLIIPVGIYTLTDEIKSWKSTYIAE